MGLAIAVGNTTGKAMATAEATVDATAPTVGVLSAMVGLEIPSDSAVVFGHTVEVWVVAVVAVVAKVIGIRLVSVSVLVALEASPE